MSKQTDKDFKAELLSRFRRWVLLTVDPLLIILHLTIVYIVALKADDLILAVIEVSFGNLVQQSQFAAQLLLGMKLFSAIGVAIGYGLHTVYQLYLEGKHVVRVVKQDVKAEKGIDA